MKNRKVIKVIKSSDLSAVNKGEKNNLTSCDDLINLLKKQFFDIVIFDFKLKLKDSLAFLNRLKFSEIKAKMIIFTYYGKSNNSLLIRKKEKPFFLIVEKIPRSLIKKIISQSKEYNTNISFKELNMIF